MANFSDNTIKLIEIGIEDQLAQENFKRLKIFLRDTPFLKMNPYFFIINIPAPITGYKFKHNLNFVPKDIIVTGVSGGATVIFDYDKFDDTFIVLTASAACTIRLILGTYKDQSA